MFILSRKLWFGKSGRPSVESLSTCSMIALWFALEHYMPVGLCVSESLVSINQSVGVDAKILMF